MSKYWYRLDNAAMIFPPVSDKNSPNTFCMSASLKEKVDKEILQKSLSQVIKSEDTFRVRLKKGLFWYYLEENTKEPVVFDEPADLMEYIDYRYGDNYLFKVYVYNNRISIVYFHALTDGTGGLYFLKQVVYRYLVNKGYKIDNEGIVKPLDVPTMTDESADKFMQVDTSLKTKKIAETKAHKLSGTPFKVFGTGLICAECDTKKVKAEAKKYNTTITGYLCGVYMYALYKGYIEHKNKKNKTIAISIPINIRKQHPSRTKRNFTLVVRIYHDFSKELSFDEIIELCAKQLKEKTTTEQIDAQIKTNTNIEKNWLMKFVPRVIKSLALKIAYKVRGTNQESTNLSNIGQVEIPSGMAEHIEKIHFILQASKTTQKNLSLTGFGDKLYMAFSRKHVETLTEKVFFKTLEEKGIDVVVQSNYQEAKK